MPSLHAQALWPFPVPHLGLAEGHWHPPGSKVLGLAQEGLSCSLNCGGLCIGRPLYWAQAFVCRMLAAYIPAAAILDTAIPTQLPALSP